MGEETYFLIQTHHFFPKATGLPPTHFLNWLVVQINNQPAVLLQTPDQPWPLQLWSDFLHAVGLHSPLGPQSATIWDDSKYLALFADREFVGPFFLVWSHGAILGGPRKWFLTRFHCYHFSRKLRFHVAKCEIPGSILDGWSGGQGVTNTFHKKRQIESYCEIIVIRRFKSPFLVTQFISTPI